jgi:hypothetical protein
MSKSDRRQIANQGLSIKGHCVSITWMLPALLAIQFILLLWEGYVHSPTLNEPGHLVAGLSNLQFREFEIYRVNPPLVRMVGALPVVLSGAKMNWNSAPSGPTARPEFALGEDFVAENGQRSVWLITLARWMCIPFSLLGGYVCFRWGRELYGPTAGLLALTLWSFCPNILGYGQLISTDVPAAALALAAGYTFWRWLEQPTWWHVFVSGLVLGVAELTKATLVIFYPLWPVLWTVYRWSEWRSAFSGQVRHESAPTSPKGSGKAWQGLRELTMLAVRMIIGIYVINLGYGFEGSCTRIEDFRFVSAILSADKAQERAPIVGGNRFADSWLASVPVPLPKNYVLGIDLQKKDLEDYSVPSYLRGQFQDKGWWYYYLYALVIKVPLGTWMLIFLAATRGIWRWGSSPRPLPSREREGNGWRDEFILLAPAFIILVFVSSQTGFSEHMRYVLPIFPFFFVWISRVAVVFEPSRPREPNGTEMRSDVQETGLARLAGPTRNKLSRQRIFAGLILSSLTWSIVSSLSVYPHSLSYFNELVGGPTGGPKHLIHSNIDWGQDLLFLKKWLEMHPEAKPLKLAYFGYFDPKYAGIKYTAPAVPRLRNGENPEDASIPPGWYAISVNFVQGLPYFSYKGDGNKTSYGVKELAGFQRLKPVAMAGYSIYIYHVE